MVDLIFAPYHLGRRAVAVGRGPVEVMRTGVAAGVGANAREVDAGEEAPWQDVNLALTREVDAARAAGSFPLVVAGNCNSCLGTLAALQPLNPGIVWFDAHGDFHTEATSISGSLEGMSLTLATSQFVPEISVILAGARDLDPGEDDRVRERLLHIPDADLEAHPLPDMQSVYVHVDVDVLDPAISPGVNFQGPGGLSAEQLLDALRFTFERYQVAALAIVNYNAEKDVEHRTRDIVVRLIEAVAEWSRKRPASA